MKRRITNLLIAKLQLLITAVWIPTFWTLAELPWTLNEKREASALLRYVDDDLGTVDYVISKAPCEKNLAGNTLISFANRNSQPPPAARLSKLLSSRW